jgi:hypothetical protein
LEYGRLIAEAGATAEEKPVPARKQLGSVLGITLYVVRSSDHVFRGAIRCGKEHRRSADVYLPDIRVGTLLRPALFLPLITRNLRAR